MKNFWKLFLLPGLFSLSLIAQDHLRAEYRRNSAALNPVESRFIGVRPSNGIALVRERKQTPTVKKVWIASLCALAASTAFDASSSMGKRELNPALRSPDGTFGARGIGIKAGLTAGIIIPQLFFRRQPGMYKNLAIANFVSAGVLTGIAAHNLSVSK